MPPISMKAVLLEMVELFTVSVPWLYMPPTKLALLPEMVELLTVSVPEGWLYMPPPRPAILPERVELLTVSVPALCMPPPMPGLSGVAALPLATVRLFRVSFAPLSTWNTRTVLLPLSVIFALPPSMISPALSVMGNCEPSVMVAGETKLKLIVSSPTPAGQSAEPDWLFWLALMMASRNEH